MKLTLSNISTIKSADIEINGLTVIAGENSTGKSTVGKLIYTIVQSFNNYRIENFRFKLSEIKSLTRDFRFLITKSFSSNWGKNEKDYATLRHNLSSCLGKLDKLQFFISNTDFSEEFCYHEMKSIFAELITNITKYILIHKKNNTKNKYHYMNENDNLILENDLSLLKQFFHIVSTYKKLNSSQQKKIDDCLNCMNNDCLEFNTCFTLNYTNELKTVLQECCRIHNKLNEPEDRLITFQNYLERQLQDEFNSGLFNNTFKQNGMVSLNDGINTPLQFTVSKSLIHINQIPDLFCFSDSTYIESPVMLYFNKYDMSNIFSVPGHIENLLSKLSTKENENPSTIPIPVQKIIEGKFNYDDIHNQFIFHDNKNNNNLSMTNVATGTKSLGMLQLLQNNGWIKKDNIIIIDEPEIHLHPKWQLEYCNVISALVSLGINFVITTHSPYIVQALKVYTDSYKATSNTNFYITNETSEGITITNTTDRLSAIYEKLTAPLRELT